MLCRCYGLDKVGACKPYHGSLNPNRSPNSKTKVTCQPFDTNTEQDSMMDILLPDRDPIIVNKNIGIS